MNNLKDTIRPSQMAGQNNLPSIRNVGIDRWKVIIYLTSLIYFDGKQINVGANRSGSNNCDVRWKSMRNFE
jgi:hypothetical protein